MTKRGGVKRKVAGRAYRQAGRAYRQAGRAYRQAGGKQVRRSRARRVSSRALLPPPVSAAGGFFGDLVCGKKSTKDLLIFVSVLVLVFGGMFYAQSVGDATKKPSQGGVLTTPGSFSAPRQSTSHSIVPQPAAIPSTPSVSSGIFYEKPAVPILMYHYVRDVNPRLDQLGWNLSISPADFERQLDYLSRNGYTSIHLSDWARGDIPKKSVIITFDDGYDDFYTTAWPLLKQYGFTASVGIITDFIGKTNHMGSEQLLFIVDGGIEPVAHTVSHSDLLNVVPSEARRQIIESKRVLEDLFDVRVAAFAYPIGHFNKAVIDFVKEAGYTVALTTAHGLAEWDSDDHYILPRIRVDNRDGYDGFVKKLEELVR